MDDYSKFNKSYFLNNSAGRANVAHLIATIGDDRQIGPDEFDNAIYCECGYEVNVHGLDPNRSTYEFFSIVKEPPADIPICEKCVH